MKTSDLALLVLLGTADSAPATRDEMFQAVRALAPEVWHPSSETLHTWTKLAIAWGQLRQVSGEGAEEPLYQTTEIGRCVIVDLLRMPIGPSCGDKLPACMAAKLCFLHHLPRPERCAHGECLGRLYQEAIAALGCRRDADGPSATPCLSATSGPGHRDAFVRLDAESTALEVMRGMHFDRSGEDVGNR